MHIFHNIPNFPIGSAGHGRVGRLSTLSMTRSLKELYVITLGKISAIFGPRIKGQGHS